MLKQHATFFRRLMILIDLLVITTSFFIAYAVRNSIEHLYPIEYYFWLLSLLVTVWSICLYYSGIYESFRVKKILEIVYLIYQSAYISFFIFASFCFVMRIAYISRLFVLLTFLFGIGFLVTEKIILILVFRRLRSKGFNYRNVVIVGTGSRAQRLIKSIDLNRELGLKIIGLVDQDPDLVGKDILGHKVIGTVEDLPVIVLNNVVDQAIFVVPRTWMSEMEAPILFLEKLGIKVDVAVDYFNVKFARARQTEFFGFPFLSFESAPQDILSLSVKRLLDIVLAALGLVLLGPVFLIAAVVIKMTSPGPVFFTQKRGSLNGRTFTLYKFRTMVRDAETKKEDLLPLNEMSGPAFKVANDPRLTPVGRFLRKYSIDELPQLWNVLKGDMSLVGPRPPLVEEIQQFDDWQRRKLSMRPGLTCLWQIQGRNKINDFDQWMKLDLSYIDHWSLGLDLIILLKTIPVVLSGRGAN